MAPQLFRREDPHTRLVKSSGLRGCRVAQFASVWYVFGHQVNHELDSPLQSSEVAERALSVSANCSTFPGQ